MPNTKNTASPTDAELVKRIQDIHPNAQDVSTNAAIVLNGKPTKILAITVQEKR